MNRRARSSLLIGIGIVGIAVVAFVAIRAALSWWLQPAVEPGQPSKPEGVVAGFLKALDVKDIGTAEGLLASEVRGSSWGNLYEAAIGKINIMESWSHEYLDEAPSRSLRPARIAGRTAYVDVVFERGPLSAAFVHEAWRSARYYSETSMTESAYRDHMERRFKREWSWSFTLVQNERGWLIRDINSDAPG